MLLFLNVEESVLLLEVDQMVIILIHYCLALVSKCYVDGASIRCGFRNILTYAHQSVLYITIQVRRTLLCCSNTWKTFENTGVRIHSENNSTMLPQWKNG